MYLISKIYLLRKRKTKWERLVFLIFLLMIVQFSGCSLSQSANSKNSKRITAQTCSMPEDQPVNANVDKFEAAEFERNCRLWLQSGVVNYDVTVSIEHPGNVTPVESVSIEVRQDKATIIEPTPKVDPIRLTAYQNLNTIDKIFESIRDGIKKGAIVKVKYNTEFGYPENVRINYATAAAENGVPYGVDDWYAVEIKKFDKIN